jgi:hypothetical protein
VFFYLGIDEYFPLSDNYETIKTVEVSKRYGLPVFANDKEFLFVELFLKRKKKKRA